MILNIFLSWLHITPPGSQDTHILGIRRAYITERIQRLPYGNGNRMCQETPHGSATKRLLTVHSRISQHQNISPVQEDACWVSSSNHWFMSTIAWSVHWLWLTLMLLTHSYWSMTSNNSERQNFQDEIRDLILPTCNNCSSAFQTELATWKLITFPGILFRAVEQ